MASLTVCVRPRGTNCHMSPSLKGLRQKIFVPLPARRNLKERIAICARSTGRLGASSLGPLRPLCPFLTGIKSPTRLCQLPDLLGRLEPGAEVLIALEFIQDFSQAQSVGPAEDAAVKGGEADA